MFRALICTVALLSATFAWSQEPAEPRLRVLAVEGTAEWRKSANEEDRWETLRDKTDLPHGAQLRTADVSTVTFIVGTSAIVVLQKNSEMGVTNVKGGKSWARASLQVVSGTMWVRVRPAKGTRFILQSPHCAALLAGGSAYFEVTDERSRVGCWEGEVQVQTRHGKQKAKANREVYCLPARAPSAERNMAPDQRGALAGLEQAIMDVGAQKVFPSGTTASAGGGNDDNGQDDGDGATLPPADTPEGRKVRAQLNVVKDDLKKLRLVLTYLYRDTGFIPGRGMNPVTGQKAILVLKEGKDPQGRELEGFKGPYIGGPPLDPFKTSYTVYENPEQRGQYILSSLGPDTRPNTRDDVRLGFTEDDLKQRAAELP